ncbi:MAG: protein kinase, partial [Gemmataceae bacterium]|nr:protein kinase [Gemmataceae bacterium]
YDIGRHQHQPFVALEYLPGGTLHSRVGNRPQPPRDAAELVRQLALAVQHAHECGVIHRDLKPANILFAEDDTPKIGDFGAARITDIEGGAAGLTQAGEVIGTPEYMAPEQARGTLKEIAPPTDVYALGAVLYHMLTGRPPHSGTDTFDVLNSVIHHEPLAPRKLVNRIPVDLETICIKAMAKRPADRYPTAQALADDLDRFLAGESIMAKPEPVAARLWRKARRRPLVSGLIAAVFAVSMAGLAGIVWQWQAALAASTLAQQNAERAVQESRIKEQSLYRSRIAQAALLIENGDNSKAAELLQMSAGTAPGQGDPRHWEWHHLNRLGKNFLWQLPTETASGQSAWPHCMAVSPSARRLAVSCGNPYLGGIWDSYQPCTLYIVDAETGEIESTVPDVFKHKIWQLKWIDENRLAVMSMPLGYRVLHIPDGEVLSAGGGEAYLQGVKYGYQATLLPDGRSFAQLTSNGSITVFDTETNAVLRQIATPGIGTRLFEVDQPRTGSLIGLETTEGTVIVDSKDGRTVFSVPGRHVDVVSVDPRIEVIVVLSMHEKWQPGKFENHATRLDCHELKSGRRLWTHEHGYLPNASQLQISPDGSRVAFVPGINPRAIVMRVADGRVECELRGHSNRILDMGFSPDGRSLATASNDGSVRYWSLDDGIERSRFRGHEIGARNLVFDPNGWRVYSGGMDGRVMAWDLTRGRSDGAALPNMPLGVLQEPVEGALWGGLWASNDGRVRFLLTHTAEYVTMLPRTGTVESIVRIEGIHRRSEKSAVDFVISADGGLLLGPDNMAANCLTLWDGRTGLMLRRFSEIRGRVIATALNADATLAAVAIRADENGQVVRRMTVYETATGNVRFERNLDGYNYQSLCFDDRRPVLYCGVTSLDSVRSGIDVVDLTTGTHTNHSERPSSGIRNIASNPDGESLAYIDSDSAGGPRLVLARRNDLGTIWSQPIVARTVGLSFSTDGRRIAIARFDDAVTLFDSATGTEVLHKSIPTPRNGDYAYPARAVFTSDGRSLVSYQSGGLLSIFQTDDWTATEARALDERRAEAATAAYSYHLREAAILADQPDSFAYRFHAGWLDRLLAPNEFLRERWEWIRSKGRR